MPKPKVAISERALVQRINRKLKPENEQLRASRTPRMESSVGRYYVLDLRRNFISSQHVDPEALGRELGVLQPWEELES